MERDRPHPGYEPRGCEITTGLPPCDVPTRPYRSRSEMTEYRVTLTLDGFPDDEGHRDDLLDALLRVASTNGPVLCGGSGHPTDIVLALDALDAVEAVEDASRLARAALASLPDVSRKIVGVSTELAGA